MWANSVWGLLGFSGSSVYAMLGLAPDSALQLPLRFSAVIFFLMSLSVLCWPLRRSEQRVIVRAKLQHPIRWAADLLEPSHVIILGLAIALGGVIWQMRASKPAIAGGSPANTVVTTSAAAEQLSDFGWGFERYPGYDSVGMATGESGQIVVQLFQAQGRNNTKDPIVKIRGSVRSDRTNQEVPILFNPGNGKLLRADEINPIPVGAIISSVAYFSEDQKPIALKQFLADWVPFTFLVEYDGRSYRRTFVLADIEPRIQNYEQEIRKSSVKPPQMTEKQNPNITRGPHYEPEQIREIILALRHMREVYDKESAPAYSRAMSIVNSWSAKLTSMGIVGFSEELRSIALEINAGANDLQGIANGLSDYKDVLYPVIRTDSDGTSDALARLHRLANDTEELAKGGGAINYAHFIEPQMPELSTAIQKYGHWIDQVQANLDRTSKEFRNWKNP